MVNTTRELIAKYPKIFQQHKENQGMRNWMNVPNSWLHIIDILCGSIQSYIDNVTVYIEGKKHIIPQVICFQMKEKYGCLRFYAYGGDDHTEGMIYMAEHLCDNTCQDCGSTNDIGRTKGWITTLCRTCAIANGDRAMANWEPLNSKEDVNP